MGQERRQHPRFHLQSMIPAAIETAHTRYTGKIQDLSVGGLLLPVSAQVYQHRSENGEAAEAEFMVGKDLVKAGGHLVRVGGDYVGMRLEKPLDPELFQVVAGERAGAVHWEDGRVKVMGAFNTTVLRDVIQAVRTGRIIDLSAVTWMDSSGLGISMVVMDRRGQITGCNRIVQPLMATGGVCRRCGKGCKPVENS